MKTPENNPEMRILKTATCKTLSAKSTLTYQLGSEDDEIYVRITKNTGAGFFNDEWVSLIDIRSVLDEQLEGTPVTSFMLQPLFKGKSVNTPAFLLAALVHEKLLRPMKGKKRHHEPVNPDVFTAMMKKMASSSSSAEKKVTTKRTTKKTGGVTKKTVTRKTGGSVPRKAPSKKAAIKKRATAKRKTV